MVGGGDDLDATMRTWSIMYSIMSEAPIDRQRLMELHDWDSPCRTAIRPQSARHDRGGQAEIAPIVGDGDTLRLTLKN